jgi:hypothetical protein
MRTLLALLVLTSSACGDDDGDETTTNETEVAAPTRPAVVDDDPLAGLDSIPDPSEYAGTPGDGLDRRRETSVDARRLRTANLTPLRLYRIRKAARPG